MGAFVVLGVASFWDRRKGLDVFIELDNDLKTFGSSKIILVGVSERQKKKIPNDVIIIPRTNNTEELRQFYAISDVLVNPSVEETYGMTQVEAKACGTVSIVYKETACEEIANNLGNQTVSRSPDAILEALKEIKTSLQTEA